MSLILKGIDLPKEQSDYIPMRIYSNGHIWINGSYKGQAIQIPEGHGRLIDADALETVFKEDAKCEWNQKVSPISWAYAFEDTINEIDNAPTILEAEEE